MVDLLKYENLVKTYTAPIYYYCYCKLSFNGPLAEETVSDVMRILFEKWDKLDVDDNIKVWLYRVADGCIKNNSRKYNRYYKKTASLEEQIENRVFDNTLHYDEYFSSDFSEEEYICRILASLPDEYKEIFRVRYIEKKTIKETADTVGLSYAALYLRLTKIEAIVKEEIKKYF